MKLFSRKKRIITALILSLLFNNFKPAISNTKNINNGEIRSIIVGHLYPIYDGTNIIEKLFKKISDLNPDYIFVLGDSKLNEKIIVDSWREKFGEKVYFAPGNGEIINGNIDKYLDVVGYKNIVVETPIVRFLVGNSNAHFSELVDFIESSIRNKPEKPNMLLIHHRIWDDTLTSSRPYSHDKSYYLKDIYPVLEKYISTMFAGNSKSQFFFDKLENRTIGRQNMNVIYWADRVGDINSYSIGTGTGRPKLGFVEVLSNSKNEAILIPHHIQTEFNDPLPLSKLVSVPGSIPPAKIKSNKIEAKIESKYFEYKAKFKKSRFYQAYLNLRKLFKYFIYILIFSLGLCFNLFFKLIGFKK